MRNFRRLEPDAFVDRLNKFPLLVAALIGLALIALVIRLSGIDYRGVHYDEALYALPSLQLADSGTYEYVGKNHGPLLYYLSAPIFLILDSTVVVGRQMIAVLSLAVFPGLFLMRRVLQWNGVLFAAAVFTFHPLFIWTARFYRFDTLTMVMLVISIAFFGWYRVEPSKRKAAALGLFIALTFATKEVAYLWVIALALPLILLAYGEARGGRESLGQALREKLPAGGIVAGVVAFFVVLILIYSGWPPNPLSAPRSILGGLALWLNRSSGGDGSSTFYLINFLTTSPVLSLLAAIGCVTTFLRPRADVIRWMLISWLVIGGALLSLLPHQTLWAHIHILTPMTLVAAIGVIDLTSWVKSVEWRGSIIDVRHHKWVVVGCLALCVVVVSTESYQLEPLTRYYFLEDQKHPDHRADSLQRAAFLGDQLDCRVLVGPGTANNPVINWFLRDVDYGYAVDPDYSEGAAVWFERGLINGLDDVSEQYRVHEHGDWRVYEPIDACG